MLNTRVSILFFFVFIFSQKLSANNILISNVRLSAANTIAGLNNAANYRFAQFDISWENSWRTSSTPNNWDAVWVFMKYRLNGTGNWMHASFNSGANQTAPSGGTIDVPSDGVGAFIYRSANGTGTFYLTGAQLRWNYGANGVLDTDIVEVKLFAIEMVYVPQGNLRVGSSGSETNSLTDGSWTTGGSIAYTITSENAITIANSAGSLWSIGNSANTIGATGTLHADFPKGFKAFYCMKYEVSQGLYRDFLNTLTYSQQAGLLNVLPNSVIGTGVLRNVSPYYRNGLVIKTPGVNATQSAEIACDLDRDGNMNEAEDGQFIACNYISFKAGISFLDWTGLRPMTELEFEKSCRGDLTANYDRYYVTNSNAAIVNTPYVLSNHGAPNENIVTLSNHNFHYSSTKNATATEQGPFRVGIFATSTNSYTRSGATRFGIMEMGGNLIEQVVNIVTTEGRAYTGLHGDGILNTNGTANVLSWPTGISTPKGYGTKGGGWNSFLYTELYIADRNQISSGITTGSENSGIRGVRSAL